MNPLSKLPRVAIAGLALATLSPVVASPGEEYGSPNVSPSPTLSQDQRTSKEKEILARVRQSLGTQGIDVTDESKLMGIAKGLGLL